MNRAQRVIVLAPDSFKGSLTAVEAAAAMEAGVHAAAPDWRCEKIPLADGGEGTVRVLVEANGGVLKKSTVTGPLGGAVEAEWGWLADEKTAVIEMAEASGLTRIPENERNPMLTSTFGTGELIRAALSLECRKMIIGIGGSATNELGAGMAQALGVRFFDERDQVIPAPLNGAQLQRIRRIDYSGQLPALRECEIHVAVDVDNPLLGPTGATYTYGPQKGASKMMCVRLEQSLAHLSFLLARDGRDVRDLPGAGAAGGLGGGLVAFCGAQISSGAMLVLQAVHFERRIAGARIILTGEGKLDSQTARGKVISAVCAAAGRSGVPVVALVGALEAPASLIAEIGLCAAFSIFRQPTSHKLALRNARQLLTQLTEQVTAVITRC